MKIIELTDSRRERIYGYPNPKPLNKWFYTLDLDRFNIMVRQPIDVLNFVIQHMTYTSDSVTHNIAEYWLQNPEDIYNWLFDKRLDDCDGSAITLASILHSIGDDRVRLALGYYSDSVYADVSQIRMNHAYCLLHTDQDELKLMDAVGDVEIDHLRNIDDYSNYYTMIMASADGRVWQCK